MNCFPKIPNKFKSFVFFLRIEDASQFNEDFIRNYNKENDLGYLIEVDVQYSKKLHEIHNDSPFLPERMKIRQVAKLVTNLHDKTEYVIHIRNLKHALNHRLVLKKVHRVIKFNLKAWLKPYIDIDTKLRQKGKNNFEKCFLEKSFAVFGKTMEAVRKHRNIKIVITERRRSYLVSEPNYDTTKFSQKID